MLVLSRGPEEAIVIGETVEVRILEVRGDRVRLGILAPSEVAVHRKEVFLSIQKENRAASRSETAGLDRALALLPGAGRGGEKENGAAGGASGPGPGGRRGAERDGQGDGPEGA